MDERTMRRWLDRGTRFFRTVMRNGVVRGELLARGLTKEELNRGFELYGSVLGFDRQKDATAGNTPDQAQAAAVALTAVDAWDAPTYRAVRSVLRRRYPAALAFLFAGLQAEEGPAALASVERFLDRVDQLRSGDAPGVTPGEAVAAAEILAVRQLVTEAQATTLRQQIATAREGAEPAPATPGPSQEELDAAETYIAWLREWREVARFAFSRRDYLIALGLASPRLASNGRPENEDDEADAADDDDLVDDA